MSISKQFGGKLIDMEPELELGFDLNYLVPLLKELPGFYPSFSYYCNIFSHRLNHLWCNLKITGHKKNHQKDNKIYSLWLPYAK